MPASRPHTRLPAAFVAALAVTLAAASAAADVFILRSGGRVAGTLLNRDESPRETYHIRTELGAELSLGRDQVKQVLTETPDQQEYARLRPASPDTVEGHWKLAQWCLERRLMQERKSHLERIVELEPDHAEARAALGYRKTGGRWLTRAEEMAARGLKLYGGRYRTSQEIELLEREKKARLAEREWHARLKRWRQWLGTSKGETAVANIKAIRDPTAVKSLVKYLEEEQHREVKLLYLDALRAVGGGAALKALVDRTIQDDDLEVRLTALDHVARSQQAPSAVALYVKSLKSKDNREVNRAALALKALARPEAIGPLIDALVTTHKYKIVTGNPGQMSTSFSRSGGGGGGMSFGGNGPKIITRQHSNQDVLSALIALTGNNFQYDSEAWETWYAAQQKSPTFDARRD